MSGPADRSWLANTSLRVDEYGRRAKLVDSGLPMPPLPEDLVDRAARAAEQDGLKWEKDGEHEIKRLMFGENIAASFSIDRHVAYVLGRPTVVLLASLICDSLRFSLNGANLPTITVGHSM